MAGRGKKEKLEAMENERSFFGESESIFFIIFSLLLFVKSIKIVDTNYKS